MPNSGLVEPWETKVGPDWWENIADMDDLDEAKLLAEMTRQYKGQRINTYVGDILCVMNPFQRIGGADGLAGESALRKYTHIPDKSAFPPHIFALADIAFQHMLMHCKNQVVTISGESGAGKTESAKQFIRMVVNCSQGAEFDGLEEKLLEMNPILESFGNAKTAMNNNSSRFGKFTQILFSKEGAIRGAMQTEYLLEKSRVCAQGPGEQNFHIFYIMFAYCMVHEDQKAKLGLQAPSSYRYVSGNDEILDELQQLVDGGEKCEVSVAELDKCFQVLGFNATEVDDLFLTLAGIMKMGQIRFENNDNDEAHIASDKAEFEEVCKNLGADPAMLELAFLHKVNVVRGQEIEIKYKQEQAADLCDSTAKALYAKAFHYIIESCNKKLTAAGRSTTSLAMGVLDIFGFENFEANGGHNSLEQLCINLANEQLQYFFCEHIFGQELKAYAAEGIDGADIHYKDNQPTLDLIMGKGNLFAILNEQSKLSRSTDDSFVTSCHNKFGKSDDIYHKPRGDQCEFSVSHYAGDVKYIGTNFLDKNRDALAVDVVGTLRIADNHLVSLIFGGEEGAKVSAGGKNRKTQAAMGADASKEKMRKSMRSATAQGGKKAVTMATQFKGSLVDLMINLNAAEPHFVRCIKPNTTKSKEWEVDDEYTSRQLRYTGMLDTTRIRREGYSSRPTFEDFLERYKILGHPMSKEVAPTGANCLEILKHAGIEGAKIGKTKVFMRYFHGDQLNDKLKPFSGAAMMIGKFGRGYLSRVRCAVLLKAKRQQDTKVKAFFAGITKTSDAFGAASEATKAEDGAKLLAVWAERKAKNEKPPEAPAAAPAAEGIAAHASGRKPKNQPSRDECVKWYQEQGDESGAGQTEDGRFCAWFHGIISRKDTEVLLKKEQDGTFLIRVAESRFGYSLSIIWRGRVKHFAIDVNDEGMHIIRGNARKYKYLNQIVAFHKSHSITDQGDKLLYPCNPGGSRSDLLELVDDE